MRIFRSQEKKGEISDWKNNPDGILVYRGKAEEAVRMIREDNNMEKKIRRKFILTSSAAVLTMLVMVLGLIVGIAYSVTYSRIYSEIGFIYENGGELPNYQDFSGLKTDNVVFTPESQYEMRYFTVKINTDSTIQEIGMSHIAALSEERAGQLASKIIEKKSKKGTIDDIEDINCKYVYQRWTQDDGSKIIVFLDCTRTFYEISQIVRLVLLIGIVSFLFFVLIISFYSRKAVRSTMKNIIAQNEFITNAGHELKTPLAIISANTEVIEMMEGKNEWTESTMNQVRRMSGLISDLIFLARMNEKNDLVLNELDYSAIARESAESFRSVVKQQKKELEIEIRESVKVKGDEKLLSELTNILLDNAVKYCDDNGTVTIVLTDRARGQGARLQVSNTYEEGKNVDYSRFFDRFYRKDTSHNSKKKGYGIGLSMAEGIVSLLHGKIHVSYKDNQIIFTVIL